MGSVIGDYIHLHFSNFISEGNENKQGTTEGEQGLQDAYKAFRDNKIKMLQKTKEKYSYFNADQLKEMKNFLSCCNLSNKSSPSETIKDYSDILYDLLKTEVENALEHPEKCDWIDFKTGNIDTKKFLQLKKIVFGKGTDLISGKSGNAQLNQQYISTENLTETLQNIYSNIDNINDIINKQKQGGLSQGEVDKLKVAVETIRKAYNKETKTINESLKIFQTGSGKHLWINKAKRAQALQNTPKNWGNTKEISDWTEMNNLIEALKTLSEKFSFSQNSFNVLRGDVLEYSIGICLLQMLGMTSNKIFDILNNPNESIVVGKKKEPVKIKMDNFSKDIDWKSLNKKFTSGDVDWNITSTQGKIDINCNIDGNPVGISAKNINLLSGFSIHVVSKTNLLFLLQDEDSSLVNYFINVIANNEKDNEIPEQKKIRLYARNSIGFSILWKSITGNTYGRTAANYFILNDNSREGPESIYIFTMPELFSKIIGLKFNQNLSLNTEMKVNNLDYFKFLLKNERKDDYHQRITDLIGQLRGAKLTVGIRPSVFLT